MSWYFYLSRKFYQRSKLSFLTIPALTLISQTSLLLAFLLPLKVLILMGSPEVPVYFPKELAVFGRDYLIVALAGVAVLLYILHIIVEKLESWLIYRESRQLVRQANKIVLFSNQNEIIQIAYLHYSRSMAGFFFIFLALAVLGLIYPRVLIFFLAYVVGCIGLLWSAARLSNKVSIFIRKKGLETSNGISNVAFLLVFFYIIYDFFQDTAPSVLIGIISLLLMRQLLTQVRAIGGSLRALYGQKVVINDLLFHGELPADLTTSAADRLWQLVNSDQREQWITSVLKRYLNKDPGPLKIKWFQTGVADVFAFEVQGLDWEQQDDQCFLIKLFDPKRVILAQNEAKILFEISSLPSPELLSVEEVEGFRCHLFRLCTGVKPLDPERTRWQMELFEQLMLAHLPSVELESQYRRSHPMIWQRLNQKWLINLRMIAVDMGDAAERQVIWLSDHNEVIREVLQSLPLTVIHAGINQDTLMREDVTGAVIAVQWGSWKLEPVGAGWPVKYLDMLDKVTKKLAVNRNDLDELCSFDVRLSALMFAIENFCRYQNFNAAINLLPQVRQCFENRSVPKIKEE